MRYWGLDASVIMIHVCHPSPLTCHIIKANLPHDWPLPDEYAATHEKREEKKKQVYNRTTIYYPNVIFFKARIYCANSYLLCCHYDHVSYANISMVWIKHYVSLWLWVYHRKVNAVMEKSDRNSCEDIMSCWLKQPSIK